MRMVNKELCARVDGVGDRNTYSVVITIAQWRKVRDGDKALEDSKNDFYDDNNDNDDHYHLLMPGYVLVHAMPMCKDILFNVYPFCKCIVKCC